MKLISIRTATVAVAMAVFGALALTGPATAAPTASGSVVLRPQGNMYKQTARPVNAIFNAKITPGPGETTMDALMESKTKVPKGLKFVPNPKQPTCSFTEAEANVPTDTALARCKKALIGNGSASLYIAQSVAAKVTDPRILIFNGGTDRKGNGKIVVQAYSSSTNAGITFSGKVANGVLDVRIPRLTYDSSVPEYQLSIPGRPIPAVVGPPPASAIPAGKYRGFVQAPCRTGKWTSSTEFFLGDRDASGNVTNRSTVTSAPYTEFCKGLRGRPAFKHLRIKGPRKVKRGKRVTYRVTLKNSGTATARNPRIKVVGAGRAYTKGPKIKPGQKRTIRVKVRITGKKGRKALLRFKAVKVGAKVWAKYRVRIR